MNLVEGVDTCMPLSITASAFGLATAECFALGMRVFSCGLWRVVSDVQPLTCRGRSMQH